MSITNFLQVGHTHRGSAPQALSTSEAYNHNAKVRAEINLIRIIT